MKANAERAIKSQKRRKENGKCMWCGKAAVDGYRCEKHKQRIAVANRNRYRLKHGIPLSAPIYSVRNVGK